jgi:hypothetical protein
MCAHSKHPECRSLHLAAFWYHSEAMQLLGRRQAPPNGRYPWAVYVDNVKDLCEMEFP